MLGLPYVIQTKTSNYREIKASEFEVKRQLLNYRRLSSIPLRIINCTNTHRIHLIQRVFLIRPIDWLELS